MSSETIGGLAEALQRLKGDNSTSKYKTDVEFVYTSSQNWPLPPGVNLPDPYNPPIRIAILDSSFNPPTKAHLALAMAPLPDSTGKRTYDARMLLLSVTNADKKLKPGDATYVQRLEMMYILADEASRRSATDPAKPDAPFCVAAIDEPTFVGKSRKLREFIDNRLGGLQRAGDLPLARVELYFILGFDTVTRLFDPRFYGNSTEEMDAALRRFFAPGPEGDNSHVVCARRTMNQDVDVKAEEEAFFSQPEVAPYRDSGSILMLQLDPFLQTLSSTRARSSVRASYEEPALGSGDKLSDLVPVRIARYIQENKLY
ncbi:SubName: Full=Uncharacterized protein {ECO:0000313/EMBL:CCA74609.1} [Serendipita indica DSM 11827]|nr:SubName: Full=Uncharacterized protein {ECO:0000313/EMBL:CCA74609.1} [Serendipita indica DSM 11827]